VEGAPLRIMIAALALGALAGGSLGAQGIIAVTPDSLLLPVPPSQLAHSGAGRIGETGAVLVPTVLLHVSINGSIRAPVQSVRTSTVVTAEYSVAGLEKWFLEQIALVAQIELTTRLERGGFRVSTYEDVGDHPLVARLARLQIDTSYGAPVVDDRERRTFYAIIAPSDTQTIGWQTPGNGAAFAALARETGATVVVPELWLQAPELGRFTSIGDARLSTGIMVAGSMDLVRAAVSFATPSGATGSISLREPLAGLSENVGEIALVQIDTTLLGTHPIVGAMMARRAERITLGRGPQPRNRGTDNYYELTIEPYAYSRAVLRGAASFFQAVANTAARPR
jgi:hypothetical protein